MGTEAVVTDLTEIAPVLKARLPKEIEEALKKPLPAEAIKPHPTKKYLSTIKPPFVIERLNEVFGVNGWKDSYDIIENSTKMIVARVTLEVPQWGITKFAFGGNDNDDRGDAYKGACTDALTKAASFLGIGLDVYKGHPEATSSSSPSTEEAPQESTHVPQTSAEPQPKRTYKQNTIWEQDRLVCNVHSVTDMSGQYGPYVMVNFQDQGKEQGIACFDKALYADVKACQSHRGVFRWEQRGKYKRIVEVIDRQPMVSQ